MDTRFIFVLIWFGAVRINGQTILPYRVFEGSVDVVIETLSTSQYVTQNFESPETIRYVFFTYPMDDISLLSLDQESGELKTAKAIDREEYCEYEEVCYLFADIGILRGENLEPLESVRLQILLEDENDNPPFFQVESFSISISESSPIGTSRSLPKARDLDSPQFGVDNDNYELSSNTPAIFRVEYANDQLFLLLDGRLDRENTDQYTFELIAYDKGVPALSSTLDVMIRVTDYNDHAPVFSQTNYTLEVHENYEVGEELLRVHASDEDIGLNAQVTYSFSEFTRVTYGDVFSLDPDTGSLSLQSELDYERTGLYVLEVLAQDQNADAKISTATVQIQVLDINDNRPRIQINTLTNGLEAQVLEKQSPGTLVAHVSVIDDDSGQNGNIICTLAHLSFDLQAIPSSTQYKIVTNEELDRERQSQYSLQIRCMDFGDPQLFQEATVDVNVVDLNDNTPRFSHDMYITSFPENNGIGAFILQVNATDADVGDHGEVTYSILSSIPPNYVEINAETGVILSATTFDYEDEQLQDHQVVLDIMAEDGGDPPNSASTVVTIDVTDINDQAPIFQQPSYGFDIAEHLPAGSSVGVVTAEDSDSNDFNSFHYDIERNDPDSNMFTIDQTGLITTTSELDRELKGIYHFSVYATDNRNQVLRRSTEIVVSVDDVNDNAPIILYPIGANKTVRISNKVPIGYEVTQLLVSDADSGLNGNLNFEINHDSSTGDMFEIDRTLGKISTISDISSLSYLETRPYVTIRDRGSPPLTASVQLHIIIDREVPYQQSRSSSSSEDDQPKESGSRNMEIIVGLTVGTIAIAIVLVIAIVCLKRYPTKKNPQDAYIHTVVPRPIPTVSGQDLHTGKFSEDTPVEAGSDDTLNSNQSNDSGKGSSESDPVEAKKPGIMHNQRPTYNRSKSADRLSLNEPQSRHNPNTENGTYLRPSPSRRQRAISESSGMMPHSPLDIPHNLPLWQGSFNRIPSHISDNSEQLALSLSQSGQSFARFSNGPSTPTTQSNAPQFNLEPIPQGRIPTGGPGMPVHPHSNQRPGYQYHPTGLSSAPATPTGQGMNQNQSAFHFPPKLTTQYSLQPPQYYHNVDSENIYEPYESGHGQHGHFTSSSVPSSPGMHYEDLNGHLDEVENRHYRQPPLPPPPSSAFEPFQNHDLSRPFQSSQQQQYLDDHSHHHQNGAPFNGYHGQVEAAQYLDQSGRIGTYSPNHYTPMTYDNGSATPEEDLMV